MKKLLTIITPETAVIDIINQHRRTETIFKRLEEETGICVCCEGLFLSMRDASEQFGFNLEDVLADINRCIRRKES
ncbi:MAG: hypothetical protein JXA41_07560 [Deltaproteobacteria bacterium]|nr:hypothetical protein [Deltaproteobacteria bacterium]